jgi:hypothetical protein
MPTHRRTWQKREAHAASLFGCKRKVLSGSSGRDDETASDSTHPRLYLETKLKAKTALRSLWEATKAKARREKKLPVLVTFDKGRQGGLVTVHEDDLAEFIAVKTRDFAAETAPTDVGRLVLRWLVLQPDAELLQIITELRAARSDQAGAIPEPSPHRQDPEPFESIGG